MATAVCDTKPCDRMQALIKMGGMYKVGEAAQSVFLMVSASPGKGTPMEMRYCPFCGTRVVQGILNRVLER